ncbi:NAD(P)H-dependent oxidoreductase [Hyphomonas sp.]|uniref:NAD(P)H-dependent oxidoreductase n=1 Tax=Hyphomonas sp. TaxID=87 RepID=UPI003D29F4C1|tara:strand:- start:12769 stop:13353 length:585 start_codon:yes stop_codon:yes gene_type:complete
MARICIIDGHPDPAPRHLIHALCDAYAEGAVQEDHAVSRINVGSLDFGFLSTPDDFATPPPEPVLNERRKISEADHLLIAFPLWLGGMPAKLRAFFEQAARAEFFLAASDSAHKWPEQMMKGKSARTVITMGMPGLVYRFGMDAGSLRALERGVLGLSGFKPLHHTILGGAGDVDEAKFKRWCTDMRVFGREGV